MNKIIIAIDGYSSTGKSTAAKAVAKKLKYIYVDTGAMYRSLTLYCMRKGLVNNTNGIVQELGNINIEFRLNPATGVADAYLNGENVEKVIRGIEVSSNVSKISAISEVRAKLVEQQQLMGHNKGIVMDGRDIGTVVFPNAELKIFMTADAKIRAERRYNELITKGDEVSLEEIIKNIEDRDYLDTHRKVSPLIQAKDALVLDNTYISTQEQENWIINEAEKRINRKLIIEINKESGFCYGVVRAIERAEKELETGELFSLGHIVHNNVEVTRLGKLGLKVSTNINSKELKSRRVLIRAHGEPPATYKAANANNIEIIDCTCPVVINLQKRVKQAYVQAQKENGQVVIFGQKGHAEVNGLVGQTDGNVIVIEDWRDIEPIDFSKKVFLFSQTTKSEIEYENLQKAILEELKQNGHDSSFLIFQNTICQQVAGRVPKLKEFAKKHQAIIFVSGKESSNGKVLYNMCKEENPNTYFIENPSDFKTEWLYNLHSVGVCGATSTPKWLLEEVAFTIQKKIYS